MSPHGQRFYRSGMTPGAWFPDPARRHELRYWNGAQWTEHVSDRGAVSVDPLPSDPAAMATAGQVVAQQSVAQPVVAQQAVGQPVVAQQVASQPVVAQQAVPQQAVAREAPQQAVDRHVYVDAQLQIGFKHKRLFVDDQAIWWDGDPTPFEAITGYSHWVTHVTAGPAHNYDYRIRLWKGGKNSTITFTGRGDQPRDAFDATVRALFERSGRIRLAALVRQVDAGEQVTLANWTLSRSGAARGRKTVAWTEPIELRATQAFAGHWVYVTRDGKQKQIGDISSEFQDGPLLRRAFEVMRERYGS